jgi:Protein of unknown function (DUF3102).
MKNTISLSSDLVELTTEINIWKQHAGQAVFEIGKRLKHIKENDLVHGQWYEYLKSIDIDPSTATRMIRAFEQFGNNAHAHALPVGKIFEMLSLPSSVDRDDFITKPQLIPSNGEKKMVSDMNRDELREVKKALQEAERRAKEAEAKAEMERNKAIHAEKLWQQAKNQKPIVQTKFVDVVPEHVNKKIAELEFTVKNLRHGYKEAEEKLKQYELMNADDFDAEYARKQREKLQHEAEMNSLQIVVQIKNFLEKSAITSFMEGALASADPITKRKVLDSIEMLEKYARQIKAAVNGRILGGVINE